MEQEFWKRCSSCKKPIPFNSKYYICSVSTCTGQRTGYQFCSVDCWEVHVPGARHRDAGALERMSPRTAEASEEPRRILVSNTPAASTGGPSPVKSTSANPIPRDVLIVASKLKDYIRAKSDMNTSANVMDVLSDYVRFRCDEAIEQARREGRKTVLDRDFKKG